MSSLSGALADFPVTEILQLLKATRAGGALRIEGTDRGVVFCADGAVTRVASRAADGLGEALVKAGLVSTADLEAMSAGGAGLATVVSNRTGPEAERLDRFLRHRTAEALFEISLWRDGTFVLDPEGTHTLGDAFSYPIDELLAAVQTRNEAWPGVTATITSVDAVAETVPSPAGDEGEVTLTRSQYRAVTAVDGRRTVREVALALGDGLFETAQALSGLVDAGLAKLGAVRLPDPAVTAEAPERRIAAPTIASAPEGAVPAGVGLNGANGVIDLSASNTNGRSNGHANGHAGDVAVPSAVPDAAADDVLPGLPTDFSVPGGRPDRGLVLRLLSAVKELQVTPEP